MIAIGIVAHPTRQTMAEQLAEQVSADLICFDDHWYGHHRNHRRTWQALTDYDTEYAIVLEDDAVPVTDFRHQCEQAIKASPTHITSLYLGRMRPPQYQRMIAKALQRDDPHYITAPQLMHGVAVAIRTEHIEPMIDFTTTREHLPWDEAVGAYARHTKQRVAYTVPSLVDHRDGPTLFTHRDQQPRRPGRVAWKVGTRHSWDGERNTPL